MACLRPCASDPICVQVDAEERARESASQGLARKLREAEARCEALAESCAELRDALDRQRQAADLREEMLKVGRRPPLQRLLLTAWLLCNKTIRACPEGQMAHKDGVRSVGTFPTQRISK